MGLLYIIPVESTVWVEDTKSLSRGIYMYKKKAKAAAAETALRHLDNIHNIGPDAVASCLHIHAHH